MIRELFLSDFSLSSCVWQSTIFLVVGLVSSFILRHRSSRAHQVLFLAMIAAVIVPIMSILVKHYELGLFVAEPVVIQSQAEDVGRVGNYRSPGVISAEDIEHKPGTIEKDLPSATLASESAKFPWRSVVLYGWIAASLILAIRLLVTFVLGVRILGQALPLHCERIEESLHPARAKLGIDKDVSIRSSQGVRSPVIWCWRRKPVLLVPSAAGRFDNGVDWAGVLCHELAHWKRRDHISGLLAELVVCILPWHPLLWWAKSRLVKLSEQACDDWVVATGQPSTDYAESLLDLTPGGQMAFVPAVVSSKRGLADRIRRILKNKCGNPRTGTIWALAVSIVAACLAIGIACAQTRPEKPETATEQKQKPIKSLQEAAIDGDIDQIKLHLSIDTAINAKDRRSRTPLHNAAIKGYTEIAKLLIAKGADVNARNEWDWTPLHYAASNGHKDAAELLISKGADINAKRRWRGVTPLHIAAGNGHKEIVEVLLANGVDVNSGNIFNRTAAEYAMDGDHNEVVKLLISKGADISPLHFALHMKDRAKARSLIEGGADVNKRTPYGTAPLHRAAGAVFKDIAELLIDNGADVNADDNRGRTPLHDAAEKGHKEIVDLLVAKGADVNVVARRTAAELAMIRGHSEVVELLISKGADISPLHFALYMKNRAKAKSLIEGGADVNKRTLYGTSPLHLAPGAGFKDIAELLIEKGANVNAKDNYNWTPLHYAAYEGNEDMVELMIVKGANVNANDGDSRTALWYAEEQGHKEVVELLLANGADVNSGAGNWTPLHTAAEEGDKDVAELLIAKGVNVNAKDGPGRTALHIASRQGHKEIVEVLLANGADVNAGAAYNRTAAEFAMRGGHSDVVALLISKGADISALHFALYMKDRDKAKRLIEGDADVNKRTPYGTTPLNMVAGAGLKDVAVLLIEKGANVNTKDNWNWTPLHSAAERGRKDVAELLIAKGANVNTRDGGGRTALWYAEKEGHTEIVELLRKQGAKE